MPDYKKMYVSLFNAVTDAVALLTECGGDLIAVHKALTTLKRPHSRPAKTSTQVPRNRKVPLSRGGLFRVSLPYSALGASAAAASAAALAAAAFFSAAAF